MKDAPSHRSVCALVGQWSDSLEGALAAQGHELRAVIRDFGDLNIGLRRALESGADWIWVLDGSAAPRPGSLLALVDALDRVEGLPEPAVMAGVVLGADGRVDYARAAWYRRGQTELAIAAAERRLLPIRAVGGPALVHRGALGVASAPHRALAAPGVVLQWSARILRARAGYLVPESESDAFAWARDALRDPRMVARLVGGRAFTGSDRLRVGFDLAERAVTRLAQGAGGYPQSGRRGAFGGSPG